MHFVTEVKLQEWLDPGLQSPTDYCLPFSILPVGLIFTHFPHEVAEENTQTFVMVLANM